jgi:beta-galactosidase/beta-glucuronidase
MERRLCRQWKFRLDDEKEAFNKDYPDTGWESVHLPHDWSVKYPFSKDYSSGTGYLCGGTAWYRKHFKLPEELKGKNIFLRFDGIYKNSQVWVNGYYLGKRPNGYISFQYDISKFACFGETENVISVRVSHEDLSDSRWFTGSGITRKVSLLVYDSIYPVDYGIFFESTRASENSAEVRISNEISSSEDMKDVRICNRLYDAKKRLVLSLEGSADLRREEPSIIVTSGMLENPCLWSPERPVLYTIETSARCCKTGQESIIDIQRVGIRSIVFDADRGFYLNGKREIIKGVCLHHDGGCLGAAMTKGIWERRLKKLKAMGCNAIRMSHNPHMPELYDLCDEMGFLVIDEAFDEWEAAKNKWHIGHNVYPPKHDGYAEDFPQWHEEDLTAMIRRDRNHPSVIMWSIGNEVDYPNDPYCHPLFSHMTGNNDQNKPEAERVYNPAKPNADRLPLIASRLADIVKRSDTSRPVTAALAFPELSCRLGFIDHLDVAGYNYKEHLYEDDHRRYPHKPIIGSENGHSYAAWRAVTDNVYIAGQFLWTGIDFLGECKGWPVRGSYSGHMTTAGFEKPDYYKRKSWWSDEAMVHIVTARASEGSGEWKQMYESWNYVPGEEIEVRCFTNQADPRLYLNGVLHRQEAVDSGMGFLTWNLIYEPGVLEVKAGSVSHRLESVNGPVMLEMVPYDTEEDEVLQIELYVKDEKGRVVRSDSSRICVKVEGDGELVGLDNGDLMDLTEYSASYRSAYEGRLMIYVRRTGDGAIIVTAESPCLRQSRLEYPPGDYS